MKRLILAAVLAASSVVTIGALAGPVQAGQTKVDVCHVDGQGDIRLISVAEPGLQAHTDHGDPEIGSSYAPGLVYGPDCQPEVVPSSPTVEVARVCNQPDSQTWSWSTTATIGEGWSVSVTGGSGTASTATDLETVSALLTITDPLGAVTMQQFDGFASRPFGCRNVLPSIGVRFIPGTVNSYQVPGGWAFQSTFLASAFPPDGLTWTSIPDGVPSGPIPVNQGNEKTFTSGVLPCSQSSFFHVVNWTVWDVTGPIAAGNITVNVPRPTVC